MAGKPGNQLKIILFANTDWYLYNFRLSLANALRDRGDDLLLLSPPGEYGQKLIDLGFRWQPLSMEYLAQEPLALIVANFVLEWHAPGEFDDPMVKVWGTSFKAVGH